MSAIPLPTGIHLSLDTRLDAWANKIGLRRCRYHDQTRTAKQDIGPGRNEQADIFGAKAELYAVSGLRRAGMCPEYPGILAKIPLKGADVILQGKTRKWRFDVKAISPGASTLNTNESALRQAKGEIDFYLPVHCNRDGSVTVYGPIAYDAILACEKKFGHSEYRSLPISQLPSLESWDDLKLILN